MRALSAAAFGGGRLDAAGVDSVNMPRLLDLSQMWEPSIEPREPITDCHYRKGCAKDLPRDHSARHLPIVRDPQERNPWLLKWFKYMWATS